MTAEKHSHIITVTGASLLLVQIATLELIKKEKTTHKETNNAFWILQKEVF